jgi:cytochrome c biogenesis protein CcmG, thiol:disulfide interchange protein DsbE
MLRNKIGIICLFSFLASSFAAPQDNRPSRLGSPPIGQATPWIGITLEQGSQGILIKSIMPGTPAEAAGLAAGDEVIAIDSRKVTKTSELAAIVQSHGVGASVELEILRKGKYLKKRIQLAARPDEMEMVKKLLVGKHLQDFNLKVISGGTSGASETFKGKVMVIEFWATWCIPCRLTHPRLSEFARANRAKDLVVIGISDEDEAAVRNYVKNELPDFLILSDAAGAMQQKLSIMAIPTFVVVNKKGTIISASIGGGSYLENILKDAEKALLEK